MNAEKVRVWKKCEHGTWLSPCPICNIKDQPLTRLKREHFIRIDLDPYRYYYSFGVPGFEICLEPCAAGFDVAIYTDGDGIPQCEKNALEPKWCTHTGDYTSLESLFGDRKDADWNMALYIADHLLSNYMKDREKLRELLENRTGMKCLFCGCTDDHACPGGCSWVEPNVCSRCKDRLRGNDLISGKEIKALINQAKTMTMKDALRISLSGKFVPVIPMELKSGYCVSFTMIDPQDRNNNRLIGVCSVGARKGLPDPADAECIVSAVLGGPVIQIASLLPRSTMLHFIRRR